MRAELAAARKEIARLQTEVTARNSTPAPEETGYRIYLIAVSAALAAAAAAAWALRRKRQRKTEAGAWWHGSHSMQAPDPSQAAFAASAASQFDLGNGQTHDLAYPVSMLPEDLDRASMFPDFLREDARPTLPPDAEAGVTLPGEAVERAPLRQAEAPEFPPTAPGKPTDVPVPLPTARAAVLETSAPFAPIIAQRPAPTAPYAAPADAAMTPPSLSRYNELDLDLDVEQPEVLTAAAPAPSPAAPAALDDGNLIDFESSSLGSFVKPSARERQD